MFLRPMVTELYTDLTRFYYTQARNFRTVLGGLMNWRIHLKQRLQARFLLERSSAIFNLIPLVLVEAFYDG